MEEATAPGLRYELALLVHSIFIGMVILDCIWKRVSTKKFNSAPTVNGLVNSPPAEAQPGVVYKLTLGCCIALSVSYGATVIWSAIRDWPMVRSHWPSIVAEVGAWFLMSIWTYRSSKEPAKGKLPSILRLWWIALFLFHCFMLVIWLRRQARSLPYSVWADIWALPLYAFLFCIALRGQMSGGRHNLDEDILQPLLSAAPRGADNPNQSPIIPYERANILSLVTFYWLNPLFRVGYKKALEIDDVPRVAAKDSAEEAYRVLHREWCSQKVKTTAQSPSMPKTIITSMWKGIALNALFAAINTCATYVGPYLVNLFVEYLGGRQQHFGYQGYLMASAFFGAKMIESLTQRQWYFGAQQLGMRVRSGLTAFIYRKGLCLSNRRRQSHTSGEIINYMSVDVERIGNFAWYMHDIWLLPIQVLLALIILYKSIGLASIAGLAATVGVMVANTPLAKSQQKYQSEIMEAQDKRMKATSETLRNMRIIKLQAWETRYRQKIEDLRKVEWGWLHRYLYTTSAVTFLFWAAPTFVSVVSFGTCVLMGFPLTAGRVLSALATFRILQEPIYNLPELVSMFAQTKVSLDRIATFVQEEELQCTAIERVPKGSTDVAIEIKDGEFSWSSSSASKPTLRGIKLEVRKGMKVAVCGTVGSGKSSLLASILGEIPKQSGIVKVCGAKAYVSQSPWVQTGKIEDNILFGKKMNRSKYENVLEACALKKDLELFSHGDQTEIGERGINLSGGQKQRIQLARAIYQDADIYLLDDPFSALDAHTGTQVFKECLLGVLNSKTIVYVTHQLEFLPASDLILVMQDGKISQAGRYEELLQVGTDFLELVGAHHQALDVIDAAENSGNMIIHNAGANGLYNARNTSNKETDPEILQEGEESTDRAAKARATDDENTLAQIVQEEERETGRVKMQVYSTFIIAAYKGALVPVMLAAHILFQLLQIGSNYWMAWATPTQDGTTTISSTVLIVVYVVLAIGSSICVLVRSLLLATAALQTGQRLFTSMLTCIFRAPMSFFDSTPAGRILNRASTDQSTVDTDIPYRLGGLAFAVIQLLGILVVMSQVAWQVFAVLIPVVAVCIWYQHYYIATARELARLVGIRKAPLIHHFAESIAGAATIRSFDQEGRFINTNLNLIDDYSGPTFHNNAAMEWLSLRLEFLFNLVFLFSLMFLVSLPRGKIDPSLAGLAVTYGLNLNVVQAWVIWNLCNVENKMISVERILQYSNIPSEAPLVIESSRPKQGWPVRGTVELQNLQVRYGAHLPLVLKGISCTFPGEKKVGVVGRTGSGKSTLLQALFRVVEPSGGRILIDGLDISIIGLHDLRSRLSIIPQDPTLFEGTIRSNLDPLGEHSDTEIWEAVDKCQLGGVLCSNEQKLDALVTENGDNWSVGQRQLVCLGRALLKRSRILVLDEATASVDTATDTIIQRTIRSESCGCTVITIAHRIPTVIDSDWVLVLGEGRIVEYDSPAKLLEDKSSSFAKLVAEYSLRSISFSVQT